MPEKDARCSARDALFSMAKTMLPLMAKTRR
jgi:hypothetical protein